MTDEEVDAYLIKAYFTKKRWAGYVSFCEAKERAASERNKGVVATGMLRYE
jgi:hypothetical protein